MIGWVAAKQSFKILTSVSLSPFSNAKVVKPPAGKSTPTKPSSSTTKPSDSKTVGAKPAVANPKQQTPQPQKTAAADPKKQAAPTAVDPPVKIRMGKPGNTLKMGIVGMANVGKSSTFNLLSNLNVPAENYPFCTIDPNNAKVGVLDERFDYLCQVWKPKSVIRATLDIVDIAGLVPGASEGAGLGNAFLSHINAVDGIFHVVRAFENPAIAHTEGRVDPIKDLEIICNELLKKDQQILAKKLAQAKRKTNEKKELEALEKATEILKKNKWLKDGDWTEPEILIMNQFNFLTAKPVVYLINVSAEEYMDGSNKRMKEIEQWIKERVHGEIKVYSVEYEQKMLKERRKQAEEKGSGEIIPIKSEVSNIINKGYECLDLIYYFTMGEDEVRCWTIRRGTKAPQAAGNIHSELEKYFSTVEIIKYNDFKALGDNWKTKQNSITKQHGKDYIVQDGDICYFKSKVKPGKK